MARSTAGPEDAIPLWEEEGKKSDPCKYWRLKESKGRRLRIEKEQFYLLKSKEKIAVPPGIAIYCRASDETIGEMRIHYAGFVHPLFGLRREKGRGTPLIFEVRGHQVDVTLADGEKMANLRFFRMSQDCVDAGISGNKKAKVPPSPYENQTLKLSDLFEDWPVNLKVDKDGNVEAA
jgi:dCTP deaminase